MERHNIKYVNKCIVCKHWDDPTRSEMAPVVGNQNLWDLNLKAKHMCLIKRIVVNGNFYCPKFEKKL